MVLFASKKQRRLNLLGIVALLLAGLSASSPAQIASFPTSQAPSLPSSEPPATASGITTGNFTGSVAAGQASSTVFPLTLKDALDRGLRQNLGLVLAGVDVRSARAARLKALSKLLPNVSAKLTESVQQNNLAAFGLPAFPGTPQIVGPFSLSDARAFVSQPLLDLTALNDQRSAAFREHAAEFSNADAREIVVLIVANLYLQAVAGESRVQAAQSQLQTAKSSFDQASHMRNAGVVAGIDVLRAQVELQARQQRLLSVQNDFAKAKLDLARAIGLPAGQEFNLADKMPYAPAPVINLETALEHALQQRADYLRAQMLVRAAEASRRAAISEALPSLKFDGNYGDIGRTFGNSHGTFGADAALNIPIFQGGKVAADTEQANAVLAQRRDELDDLRGQIDAEVRKAFLDLQAASEQVEVTRQEVDLASQTLTQSRDRFAAGVADNLEVVQAQEALANANEVYIDSVYAHNVAKASLARVVGVAEKSVKEFLGAR